MQTKHTGRPKSKKDGISPKLNPLTTQEQEFVQAKEDEYRRDKLVDELIEIRTGKG